jgi:hypothetical protein
MARVRKFRFWMDSSAGTLVEFSSDVNSLGVGPGREALDDTGSNSDDRSRVPGIRNNVWPISFFVDTTSSLYRALLAAERSSVTKTVQYYDGLQYQNGEVVVSDLQHSGDGKALATGSANLNFDGSVNYTSVALS